MYLFMEFCSPAKFYVIAAFLTALYFVIRDKTSILVFLFQCICFIGWAFLLNWLCKAGYKAIAWLVAIVPHSIFLLVTMLI